MKSLLFVINTLGRGGAEAALIALLNKLDPEEYDIDLYVMLGQGDLVHRVPDYVHILNEKFDDTDVLGKEGRRHIFHHLMNGLFGAGTFFKNVPYMVSNWNAMRKAGGVQPDKLCWKPLADSAPVFEKEYDLAVAYLEGASTYYVSRYVTAKNKACFIHIDYESSGYTRELDMDCFERMDRIFTVSEEVKQSFINVYPEYEEKLDIIRNIVDRERILSEAKLDGGFEDEFDGKRILTVARLHKQKALDVSIRAAELLRKRNIPFRWYVLGEGDERPYLESLIHEVNLEDQFFLLGIKDNPFPYYAQCDYYVHCSRFEGRSIAIQEAMILGCPVVVSDCPGNRETVIHNDNGLLVEFNEHAIADAITRLYEEGGLAERLGKAASEIELVSKDFVKMLELAKE